jgi:hypothetical protein
LILLVVGRKRERVCILVLDSGKPAKTAGTSTGYRVSHVSGIHPCGCGHGCHLAGDEQLPIRAIDEAKLTELFSEEAAEGKPGHAYRGLRITGTIVLFVPAGVATFFLD